MNPEFVFGKVEVLDSRFNSSEKKIEFLVQKKKKKEEGQWISIDSLMTLKAFECIWAYEGFKQKELTISYYNANRNMISEEYKKKYIGVGVDKVVAEGNTYDEVMEMMVECDDVLGIGSVVENGKEIKILRANIFYTATNYYGQIGTHEYRSGKVAEREDRVLVRLYTPKKQNSIELEAMLDTGADCTCLTTDTLKAFEMNKAKSEFLTVNDCNSTVYINGYCQVQPDIITTPDPIKLKVDFIEWDKNLIGRDVYNHALHEVDPSRGTHIWKVKSHHSI